jgi:hypothetical protein
MLTHGYTCSNKGLTQCRWMRVNVGVQKSTAELHICIASVGRSGKVCQSCTATRLARNMNKPKYTPQPSENAIARIGIVRRHSSRPHALTSQVHPHRLQEKILEIFKKSDYDPMDLETLIFFVMQNMDVSIHTYESMQRTIKNYIMANFGVVPGKLLTLHEVGMRRLTIICSKG